MDEWKPTKRIVDMMKLLGQTMIDEWPNERASRFAAMLVEEMKWVERTGNPAGKPWAKEPPTRPDTPEGGT